jgi:hypothetical protein
LTESVSKILQLGAVIVLAVCVLSGCGALYRQAKAWKGHPIDQLIESWGEPDSQTDLGQGLRAYTWVGEDDACEHTFTTRNDKIIGVSDTGCSS